MITALVNPDPTADVGPWAGLRLQCPVSASALAACPAEILAPLQRDAAIKALRNELAGLVEPGFEAGLITRDGARCYPVYAGIPDLRPGAAVLLTP